MVTPASCSRMTPAIPATLPPASRRGNLLDKNHFGKPVASGTSQIQSGNGSPLRITAKSSSTPQWADGILGNGLHFPTPNENPIQSKPLTAAKGSGATVMFWLKPGSECPGNVPLLSAGKSMNLRLNQGELQWTEGGKDTGYLRIVGSKGAALQAAEWRHIALRVGAKNRASEVTLYVDGRKVFAIPQVHGFDGAGFGQKTRFEVGSSPSEKRLSGDIDELRFFPFTLSSEDIWAEFVPGALALAQTEPNAPRDKDRLRDIRLWQHETTAALWQERCAAWEKLLAFERTFPTCMVMADMQELRPTFILQRGKYAPPVSPWKRECPRTSSRRGRGERPATGSGWHAGLPNPSTLLPGAS